MQKVRSSLFSFKWSDLNRKNSTKNSIMPICCSLNSGWLTNEGKWGQLLTQNIVNCLLSVTLRIRTTLQLWRAVCLPCEHLLNAIFNKAPNVATFRWVKLANDANWQKFTFLSLASWQVKESYFFLEENYWQAHWVWLNQHQVRLAHFHWIYLFWKEKSCLFPKVVRTAYT